LLIADRRRRFDLELNLRRRLGRRSTNFKALLIRIKYPLRKGGRLPKGRGDRSKGDTEREANDIKQYRGVRMATLPVQLTRKEGNQETIQHSHHIPFTRQLQNPQRRKSYSERAEGGKESEKCMEKHQCPGQLRLTRKAKTQLAKSCIHQEGKICNRK